MLRATMSKAGTHVLMSERMKALPLHYVFNPTHFPNGLFQPLDHRLTILRWKSNVLPQDLCPGLAVSEPCIYLGSPACWATFIDRVRVWHTKAR